MMQDLKTWNNLSKHLAGEESPKEKEQFLTWLHESDTNKQLFNNLKNVWDNHVPAAEPPLKHDEPLTFLAKFSRQRIKNIIIQKALGNGVGFVVGMWVTSSFSHHVLERKSIKNLFGLAGRKSVVVNEIPEWLQGTIAILVGFLALELINHFFQTKKYLIIWDFLKKKYSALILKN